MTVRSGWLLPRSGSGGQSREDTRLVPVGTMTPAAALTTRSGVIPGGTPLVVAGSGMTATVSTGRAYVQGTSAQGAYPVAVTATENVVIPDGNGVNPRIDLIVVRVRDNFYDASGSVLATVERVAGTPASIPAAPSAPAASLVLAEILVGATNSAGNPITWGSAVTDRRVWTTAVGGINPDGATAGAHAAQYRDGGTTTGLERYNGSAWESRLYLGTTGRVVIGSDVELYRNAANVLRTPDSLVVDGALTVSGVGQWQAIFKTGDTPRNSTTTLADDPHLTLPVVANARYLLEAYLSYDGPASGTPADLKMDWSIPASATLRYAPHSATPGANANALDTLEKAAGAPYNLGTYGAGARVTAAVRGWVLTSGTAGSVTLRWAQVTSNASAVTLYSGSWLRLFRVV